MKHIQSTLHIFLLHNYYSYSYSDIRVKLIRMSKSPHSSPAFMVRNHAEIKRGKARMVINYKELNKHCIFDGYFIPNKNNLINLAKGIIGRQRAK